jgi:hypothetical protein
MPQRYERTQAETRFSSLDEEFESVGLMRGVNAASRPIARGYEVWRRAWLVMGAN